MKKILTALCIFLVITINSYAADYDDDKKADELDNQSGTTSELLVVDSADTDKVVKMAISANAAALLGAADYAAMLVLLDINSSDITFSADTVPTTSVYSGTTSLEETTAANDSGAYIVGVFDEFGNSNGSNLQDVVDDIDAQVTTNITNTTPVDTGDENATFYPLLVDGPTGTQATETDAELNYNPNSDLFTIPNIASGTMTLSNGGTFSNALTTSGHAMNFRAYDDGVDWVNVLSIVNGADPTATCLGVWDFSSATSISFPTMTTGTITVADEGIAIQAGTSVDDFFEFAAYDTDSGPAYEGLIRLVSGTTIYGYLGDNQTNALRWDESGNLALLGTGTFDAGAAASVEIPNATDPDVDAAGELSWDSDDFWLRTYDGSGQRAVPTEYPIYISVAEPDTMDARDFMPIFTNNTGASITIISIYAMADDDDTDFRIEEYDADGSSNEALVKAETCDTGSGPYTNDGQTTITNATVEDGHILVLDFDDTDTPDYLHFTIWYTINGNVD